MVEGVGVGQVCRYNRGMELHAGDRVDHYTLLEPLGEGGQGTVWKVVDPRDGGVVRALKLVSLAETGPGGFDRARREARILASARHPALVTCHSLFEEPREGVVGLVMDLVPGRSLAEAADAGRLDRGQSLAVLAQVAGALAYVHGAGLVHRNLKPENLLLTDGFWEEPGRLGAVKLVDFGIATSTGNPIQLTAPGAVIGTLPYLAPELIDPATWGRTEGPARDVFAFGVLACRLLLDRHPTGLGFDATMIDYARAYKAAEAGRIAWPPRGLEGTWGAAVAACLALRPADRPADGAALDAMLRGEPPGTGPTSPHRAPSGAGWTEPMQALPVRPASTVKTVAAAPLGAAATPAPSSDWQRGAAVGAGAALLVLAGAVGAMNMLRDSSPERPPDRWTPQPPPQEPSSSPPAPVAPTAERRLAPCRKEGLGFDPKATRFECPVCDHKAANLPSRRWQMRIGEVTPISGAKKVCAQVDPRKEGPCVPVARLPDLGGPAERVDATTEEIEKGVYFSLRDATGTVVSDDTGTKVKGMGHIRDHSRAKETALCSGLVLYIGDTGTRVTVFLDER